MVTAVLFLGGSGLPAQSYQSSFSEVKFDRAKGPATLVSGIQVDAASGAASMSIPMGPGIGERGLKFRPSLDLRIAPQLGISSSTESILLYTWSMGVQYWTTQIADTLYQRGYGTSTFSPGSFDLALDAIPGQQSSYSLPGGGGGTLLGTVPGAMTPSAAQQVINRFNGAGALGNLGTFPALSASGSNPFIQVSSSGHLILGLNQTGASDQGTDEVQDWVYSSMIGTSALQKRWPRRILVVTGEVAYEFSYGSHRYLGQVRPYIPNDRGDLLASAHYGLTRILNRFGECVTFTYDNDGIGYTAKWSTNPSVQIRVQVVGTPSSPAIPSLTRSDLNVGPTSAQVRVSYLGIGQPVPTYLLTVASPAGLDNLTLTSGGSLPTVGLHGNRYGIWGAAAQDVQPLHLTQEASGETIDFSYMRGPSTSWGGLSVAPTILSAVTFPNRVVSLEWEAIPYQPNFSPNAWGSFKSPPRRPAYAYGVKRISDQAGGMTRTTTHSRVVPQLNWFTGVPAVGEDLTETWVSRDFYTAVTTPDGRTTLHRFTEPDPANGTTGEAGMRTLAYLKHVERETRYYEAGVDWQADLPSSNPSASSAYRWEARDCFSVFSAAAAGGSLFDNATPYPTRTRSWERDSQTFEAVESNVWSGSQLGWTERHRTTALTSNPSMGLSIQARGSYASPGATLGTEDCTTYTLDNRISEWLLGRVTLETTVRLEDHTGAGLTTGAPAPVAKVQDGVFNTMTSTTSGDAGSCAVQTTLSPKGSSGLAAAQLQSALLSSPQGFTGSTQVGVSAYGYDGNGFLNSINVNTSAGTSLQYRQDQDELGRPTFQYDPNGRVKGFSWDSSGRLSAITPPGGDQATQITYNDSDHLGITLTRGAQVQEFRYNGFGELILVRRKDASSAWSHRILGRDAMGRSTGETVWLSGRGDDHEYQWGFGNLTETITVTIPGTSVCKRWGPADPDTGERECVQWQITQPTTQTYNPLYLGSSVDYDGRGRIMTSIDASGVTSVTTYPAGAGLQKWVTVGGTKTTKFLNDASGRLQQVTDAAGQVSRYGYDASNRLVTVTLANAQLRTWTYNNLGWLQGLTQPETGSTTYSNFTIQGKPQTTNYNGRVVRGTFDLLGRLTGTSSDDGTVSQSFGYDTAAGGLGQAAWTQDGTVASSFGYDAATGRLVSLTSVAAGNTYTQTFGYDTYGNRTSGNTSHGNWTQSFLTEMDLPKLLAYGTQTIADCSYDPVSWLPSGIQYGNAASSTFAYYPDQIRLMSIAHKGAGGLSLENWVFTSYDGWGNLLRQLDSRTGLEDVFQYDNLDRLIGASIQSSSAFGAVTQTFGYDAFGNRISGQTTAANGDVPTTSNLTLDPNNEALVNRNQMPAQMTNGAYTGAIYDAQGNLTQIYQRPGNSANTITMTYDALGRVTRVNQSGKGIGEVYQYRADGLRTVIDDYLWGVYQKTRIQVYNDARQLVAQYEKSPSGSLTWKRDVLYLGTREAAEYDAQGMHVTQVDHLGSPRVVTGPTGALEARQKYLPFGELLDGPGALKTAKGYTGHEQTDDSGLIYMQARFYLPQYGRFASPDPARDQHFEQTQSWNIYSYVQNNPVMRIDPTGLAIELTGDEAQRARQLAAAQQAVGSKAGSYLYDNKVETKGANGTTTTTHSIGIYTNGPDGKGAAFGSINKTAAAMSDVIGDKRVAVIDLVPAGTKATDSQSGGSVKIGRAPGATPGATTPGADGKMHLTLLDQSNKGSVPGSRMSNGRAGAINTGNLTAHELGHLHSEWFGGWFTNTFFPNRESLSLENDVRTRENPDAATRTDH